jgi:hypothetical protein
MAAAMKPAPGFRGGVRVDSTMVCSGQGADYIHADGLARA